MRSTSDGLVSAPALESRTYNPGHADEVFHQGDDGSHLNLITCDGVWDGVEKSYSKRLVIFADIVREEPKYFGKAP